MIEDLPAYISVIFILTTFSTVGSVCLLAGITRGKS